MDEISQLIDSANQSLDFLERLREDCSRLDYQQVGGDGVSSLPRVESAIDTIKYSNQMMQRNLDELSSSLNVVSISAHKGIFHRAHPCLLAAFSASNY